MREFLPGTSIDGGKYVLLQLIGRGGMGIVYRAQQVRLGRDVAIKFVDCDPEHDQRLIQRFQLEARTLATLDHPNILDVYDVGDHEGYPYLVMELVEGGSLEPPMGYPMDLRDVARVLNDVAGALDYLHAKGVVHRDLKPSNILMGQGGRAILSDFGVVKIMGANLTGADSRAPSTPLYQSPEQIAGSEITPLSDIYSLGVVIYHLATGYPPYQGPTRQTIEQRHMSGMRAAPRGLNPDLPEAAEAAIVRAMAVDPAARYQTAGDFARDFARGIEPPTADDFQQTVVMPRMPDYQQTVVMPRAPARGGGQAPAPTGAPSASPGSISVRQVSAAGLTKPASYVIVVMNAGTEPGSFALSAGDEANACVFELPASAAVPGRASVSLPLSVKPRSRRFSGKRISRRFEVAARSADGASMSAEAAFADAPLPVPLFAVGGIAVAVLAVLGFVVLGGGKATDEGVVGEGTPVAEAHGVMAASDVPEVALKKPTPIPAGSARPAVQGRERVIDEVVVIDSDTVCTDDSECTLVYSVGPYHFRDSLLRIDFSVEVKAPPGKGVNWISDPEWHAKHVADGEPGERVVSDSGASYPLVAVGGIAGITNPQLRAGRYTGYWDFTINEKPGATLTFEYPDFEIVDIVVP